MLLLVEKIKIMGTNIDLSIDKVISQLKAHIALYFIGFVGSFNLWFLTIYFVQSDFIAVHGLVITLLTTFAITLVGVGTITITAIKEQIAFHKNRGSDFELYNDKIAFSLTTVARQLYGNSVWLLSTLIVSYAFELVCEFYGCNSYAVAIKSHLLIILLAVVLFYISANYQIASSRLYKSFAPPSKKTILSVRRISALSIPFHTYVFKYLVYKINDDKKV